MKMPPNPSVVPTPGTARHVSCGVRGGRGTSTRYLKKSLNSFLGPLQYRQHPRHQ
jgi:hypothetical protein